LDEGDLAGLEFDWLASDRDGHVALLTTAGGGFVSPAALTQSSRYAEAIESLLRLPECGVPLSFSRSPSWVPEPLVRRRLLRVALPTGGCAAQSCLPRRACRAQSWSCSPSTSSSGESNSPHETGSGGSQRRRRDRDGVPVDRDAAIWTITGAPRDGGLRHEGVARGEGGDQCSAPQLMTTSLMLGVRLSAGEPSPAAALEAIGFVPTDPVLDRYGLRVCDSFDRWSAGFRWGTCPQRAW
jgi:hypothetical protein